MEAENILQSLEYDAGLIPLEIRSWWIHYLHSLQYAYLDSLSFLNENDKGKKILEIGSVPGHFTVLLKKLGYDVRGVDIDPNRVKQIWDKYNITVNKVDIEKEPLPFSAESFDIVFFTATFEHLRINPLYTLCEIHRVLKKDGRMIFSTANITPMHRLFFLFGGGYQGNPLEEFRKLEWLGHMGHIRLYSFKEVKEFLESVGFRIVFHTYKGKVPRGWMAKLLMLWYPIKKHLRGLVYVIANRG